MLEKCQNVRNVRKILQKRFCIFGLGQNLTLENF